MVTDTMALADAILAMHEAVAASEMADGRDPMMLHFAMANEHQAGRALLVAIDGVPERLRDMDTLIECARNLADSCTVERDSDEEPYDTYSVDAQDALENLLWTLDLGGSDGR